MFSVQIIVGFNDKHAEPTVKDIEITQGSFISTPDVNRMVDGYVTCEFDLDLSISFNVTGIEGLVKNYSILTSILGLSRVNNFSCP